MPLVNHVKEILTGLMQADSGWEQLLALHGWPFDRAAIAAMSDADFEDRLLNHALDVDPSVSGFQDFATDSNVPDSDRMIVPGRPSRSLLYHALVSPNVVEHVNHTMLVAYPTLGQIDTVENYVYAARNANVAALVTEARQLLGLTPAQPVSLAVAVFTSEYRPAPETPHGIHADLCLARTGIARVGNKEPLYVPQMRGFQVFIEGDDNHDIRVLPCRYSAWLAVQAKGRRDRFGPVFSGSETIDDSTLDFWVPLHKLFEGDECLNNLDLTVSFSTKHFNQKIGKLVARLKATGFSNVPNDVLSEPDYEFTTDIAELLAASSVHGPGVVQPPAQAMVEEAVHQGQSLSFEVPPMGGSAPYSAGFSPSLSLDAPPVPVRPWPEYAHIRQRTDSNPPEDINKRPDVVNFANAGGFDAQHYKDFAGDGWVTGIVVDEANLALSDAAGNTIPAVSAYSLVAAPDFYPNVSQRQVFEWWSKAFADAQNGLLPAWWEQLVNNGTWRRLWERNPEPLSDERVPADFQLPSAPFDSGDNTVTGIVTPLQQIDLSQSKVDTPKSMRHSFLPDTAAGLFAPGWDASVDRTNDINHLTAYGLGSPFPEDAKLCAALSTFWPAVAPDVTRTFFPPRFKGTVCPMTDDEVGVGGDGISWDGLTGPHIVGEDLNERVIEYADFAHADYTRAALNNEFSIAKTSRVSLAEYQHRVLAMLRCYSAVSPQNPASASRKRRSTHIFSFRQANFDSELNEAQMMTGTTLTGPVYRFELFTDEVRTTTGTIDNVSAPVFLNDNHQLRLTVQFTWTVFVGSGHFVLLRWKLGDGSADSGNWFAEDV